MEFTPSWCAVLAGDDVLRRARWSTVLLHASSAAYALVPWSVWRSESAVLRALERLATEPGGWSEAALVSLAAEDERAAPAPWGFEVSEDWGPAFEIAAAGEPVALRDRGVPVCVLQLAESAQRGAGLVDHYRNIVRVLTVADLTSRGCAVPLREWLAVSPYPWLSLLAPDAVGEFTSECALALAAGVRANDPADLDTVLSAWRASCETRRDAGLAAALEPTGGRRPDAQA
jgi:hypothetical protein